MQKKFIATNIETITFYEQLNLIEKEIGILASMELKTKTKKRINHISKMTAEFKIHLNTPPKESVIQLINSIIETITKLHQNLRHDILLESTQQLNWENIFTITALIENNTETYYETLKNNVFQTALTHTIQAYKKGYETTPYSSDRITNQHHYNINIEKLEKLIYPLTNGLRTRLLEETNNRKFYRDNGLISLFNISKQQ